MTAAESNEVPTDKVKGALDIEVSRVVPQPIDKVWQVLTTRAGAEAFLGSGAQLGTKGEPWHSVGASPGVVGSYRPQEQGRILVGVPRDADLLHRVVAANHSVTAVHAVPRLTLGAELGATAEEGLRTGTGGQDLPDLVYWLGHHPTYLDVEGALHLVCRNLVGLCCCHRDLDPFRPNHRTARGMSRPSAHQVREDCTMPRDVFFQAHWRVNRHSQRGASAHGLRARRFARHRPRSHAATRRSAPRPRRRGCRRW